MVPCMKITDKTELRLNVKVNETIKYYSFCNGFPNKRNWLPFLRTFSSLPSCHHAKCKGSALNLTIHLSKKAYTKKKMSNKYIYNIYFQNLSLNQVYNYSISCEDGETSKFFSFKTIDPQPVSINICKQLH